MTIGGQMVDPLLFFLTKKVSKKVKAVYKSCDFACWLRRRKKNSPFRPGGATPFLSGWLKQFFASSASINAKSGFVKGRVRRAALLLEWYLAPLAAMPLLRYHALLFNKLGRRPGTKPGSARYKYCTPYLLRCVSFKICVQPVAIRSLDLRFDTF